MVDKEMLLTQKAVIKEMSFEKSAKRVPTTFFGGIAS